MTRNTTAAEARHRFFASEFMANGENAVEAYRAAGYGAPDAKPGVLAACASRLLKTDRVQAFIAQLRVKVERSLGVDLIDCGLFALKVRDEAYAEGQSKTALMANAQVASIIKNVNPQSAEPDALSKLLERAALTIHVTAAGSTQPALESANAETIIEAECLDVSEQGQDGQSVTL